MQTSLPPLKGKTALVTGGAGGIGAASARALLADGAAVVLMGRRRDALERTRQELGHEMPGSRIEICAGDAGDEADVQDALTLAWSIGERLDIVVATVGGGAFRPLLMHDAESFRTELDMNVLTTFLAVRHAAPMLASSGGGSIVCVSSTAARTNFRWLSAFCTAKAGLEAFVQGAAEELGSANIRINAVRPGLTRTESTVELFEHAALLDRFREQVPLGTLGEPVDVAHAVRYLAGPESGWVTGQSFAIDGGQELRSNPRLDEMIGQIFGADALRAVLAGRLPEST